MGTIYAPKTEPSYQGAELVEMLRQWPRSGFHCWRSNQAPVDRPLQDLAASAGPTAHILKGREQVDTKQYFQWSVAGSSDCNAWNRAEQVSEPQWWSPLWKKLPTHAKNQHFRNRSFRRENLAKSTPRIPEKLRSPSRKQKDVRWTIHVWCLPCRFWAASWK